MHSSSFLLCLSSSALSLLLSLLAIAFLTLVERKLMASVQLRLGPNELGLYGILQPFADGIKLLTKELIVPSSSYSLFFLLSPFLLLCLSLCLWAFIPFGPGIILVDYAYGILIILAISSLNVHCLAFAGWSSQSSYALLGSLRSTAQMVSYELVLSTIFLVVLAFSHSLNMTLLSYSQSHLWLGLPLMPLLPLYMIALLAETNRAPFDLPEAEAELVAGYNVEYGSGTFAFFFLAEYSNMLILSTIGAISFLGGWYMPFPWCPSSLTYIAFLMPLILASKASLLIALIVLIRAAYPRYRYDQLMMLGWKTLLPLTIAILAFVLTALCLPILNP